MKNVCALMDSLTGELTATRFEDIWTAKTKTNLKNNEFLIIIKLKTGDKITAKLESQDAQKAALNNILQMMNTDNEEPPEEVKEAQRQAAKEAHEKALREAQHAAEKFDVEVIDTANASVPDSSLDEVAPVEPVSQTS